MAKAVKTFLVLLAVLTTFSPSLLQASVEFMQLQQLNEQYQLAYRHYQRGCHDSKCSQEELEGRFKVFRQALARYQVTLNSKPSLAVKVDMPMVTKPVTGIVRKRNPIRVGSNYPIKVPVNGIREEPSVAISPLNPYDQGVNIPSSANIGGLGDLGPRPCNPDDNSTNGAIGSAGAVMPQLSPTATSAVGD